MAQKKHKKAVKNPIFYAFLAIFSFFFIVFFSFFSSAQVSDTEFSGLDFNLSADISGTARDFQVFYTGTDIDKVLVLNDQNIIYEFNITGNIIEKFNVSSMVFTGNTLNLTSFLGGNPFAHGFFMHGLGTRIYISTRSSNADSEVTGTSGITQLTLTDGDITTASSSVNYSIPQNTCSSLGTFESFSSFDNFVSPDGTKILFIGRRVRIGGESAFCMGQINLNTPLSLSTVSSVNTKGTDTITNSRLFMTSQKVFFAQGSFTPSVSEYNLTVFDVSTLSSLQETGLSGSKSVQPSTTPISKFLRLTTNNVLETYNVLPEQIQSMPDINMGFQQEQTINLNNYFTGIGDLQVTALDINTGEAVFINSGQFTATLTDSSGTLPILQIRRTSSSTSLDLQTYGLNANVSITVVICSDDTGTTCINDNFRLTIDSSFTPSGNPPAQIRSFSSQNLLCTGLSPLLNMKSYFSDFTSIRLSYVDFILNETIIETVSVGTPTTIVNNGSIYSAINTYEDDILINFASNCLAYSQPITITAINSDGSTSDQFFLTTSTSGTPTQQPQGSGVIANIFIDLFPNADSLSLFEKMIYVFITLVLTFIIVIGISIFAYILFGGSESSRFGIEINLWIILFLYIIEFLFFIAIGYIPVWLIFTAILIIIVLAGLKFWGGNSGS